MQMLKHEYRTGPPANHCPWQTLSRGFGFFLKRKKADDEAWGLCPWHCHNIPQKPQVTGMQGGQSVIAEGEDVEYPVDDY